MENNHLIYIASSWKNQHAVEMLTAKLRARGYTVASFVENNFGELAKATNMGFDEWINSEDGESAFIFDTAGATCSRLVIYVGPSGNDAWAEVGAAYGSRVPIIGLWSKGEQVGLMRRMIKNWCHNYKQLLKEVDQYLQPGIIHDDY